MNNKNQSRGDRNFKLRSSVLQPTERENVINYPPKSIRDLTAGIQKALEAEFISINLVPNTREQQAERNNKGKSSKGTTRRNSSVELEM